MPLPELRHEMRGEISVHGRIRGVVHGYIDANVHGTIRGEVNAMVETDAVIALDRQEKEAEE